MSNMTVQITTRDGDLFNEALVRSYVDSPRFLRRDWLVDEVAARLVAPDCRFVLLTAEPGAGKSTFMAQLAHDHADWPRYFIRRDQRTPLGDVAAHSFLLRIGYQLAALHPDLFTPEQVQLTVEQRMGTVEAAGDVIGAEVKRLLASPFYQKVVLIQQHVTQNRGKVVGLRIEELVVEPRLLEPAALANMALFDPARALLKLDPTQQIVILVDALDEIRYHDTADNILKWLTNCPELPANVRFVLTSRPPDTALQLFCDKQAPTLRPLPIAAENTQVQTDVRTYVTRLTGEPQVAAELAKREAEAAGMEARLALKAHGNLGYLAALARAIDDALDRRDAALLSALLDLRDLPDDLEDLYAFFLHQIQAEVEAKSLAVRVTSPGSRKLLYLPAWPAVYQPLLAVLAVALAPLALDQIKDFSETDADRTFVLDALGRLGQFLDESGGRYRLYHATVAELLTGERTRDRVETADLYADPVEWHGRIATYLWETHSHDWSTCDDYGLNSLATHLYKGHNLQRLLALVEENWIRVRHERSDYTYDGLLGDLDIIWRAAEKSDEPEIRAGRPAPYIAQQVRSALGFASVNSLASNIPTWLFAARVKTSVWTPAKALSYARRVPDSTTRFEVLITLAAQVAEPVKTEALGAAFSSAKQIIVDEKRAQALTKLLPYLPEALRPEALALAVFASQQLTDQERKLRMANYQLWALIDTGKRRKALNELAETLSSLSAGLSQAELAEQLRVACEIEDMESLTRTLDVLAAQLDKPRQLIEAIEETNLDRIEAQAPEESSSQLINSERTETQREALTAEALIGDDHDRAAASAALTQYRGNTPGSAVTGTTNEAAQKAEFRIEQGKTTKTAASQLSAAQLTEAFAKARTIKDDHARYDILIDLAPYLPQELVREALVIAREISNGKLKAELLAALALHYPDSERTEISVEALNAVERSWMNEVERVEILATLADQLPQPQRMQVLDTALSIARQWVHPRGYSEWTASGRYGLFIKVIPHLDDPRRTEAVGEALEIIKDLPFGHDHPQYQESLATLVPFLSKELLPKGELVDEEGVIPSRLPETLLPEALAVAKTTRNEKWLWALARRLPPSLLVEVLDAAKEIGGDSLRAEVLSDAADAFAQLAPAALYPAWRETLHGMASLDRPVFLHNLQRLSPIIVSLGGQRALEGILSAIQDVGRWWP